MGEGDRGRRQLLHGRHARDRAAFSERNRFHGYYDQHMYHPLLAFDGEGCPVAVLLRPGNAANGAEAVATLLRLFEKIAERLPAETKFLFRADAGFALPMAAQRRAR